MVKQVLGLSFQQYSIDDSSFDVIFIVLFAVAQHQAAFSIKTNFFLKMDNAINFVT